MHVHSATGMQFRHRIYVRAHLGASSDASTEPPQLPWPHAIIEKPHSGGCSGIHLEQSNLAMRDLLLLSSLLVLCCAILPSNKNDPKEKLLWEVPTQSAVQNLCWPSSFH